MSNFKKVGNFKRVLYIVVTLLLLLICHPIGYAQKISRTINYSGEHSFIKDGIRKTYALPAEVDPEKHFQLYFNFELRPERVTADLRGVLTLDQDNRTLQIHGTDGNLRSSGGSLLEGVIRIAFEMPIPLFSEEPIPITARVPIPYFPQIDKTWNQSESFSSFLMNDEEPIHLRAGLRDLVRLELTAVDIVEAIIDAVTTGAGVKLPGIAIKAMGKAVEIAVGNAAISYNVGFLSTSTLVGEAVTLNGTRVTREKEEIPAPGLDMSQSIYEVDSIYDGRFTYQLDWVTSSDVWLEFNPLGIPIWSYPKTVIAEFPTPLIPETEYDMEFETHRSYLPLVDSKPSKPLVAIGRIPTQTLTANDSPIGLDVGPYFSSASNNHIYAVQSTPSGIVGQRISGSQLTITPRSEGSTTIVITAYDSKDTNLYAIQTVPVTVQSNRTTTPPPNNQPFIPDLGNRQASRLEQGSTVEDSRVIIQVDNFLNLRSTPRIANNKVGTVRHNAKGTVTDGPISAGGYNWWKVEWDASNTVNWIDRPRNDQAWCVEATNAQVLFRIPPDVEIRDFDVDDNRPKVGERLKLEVEVRNNGPGRSAPTEITLYYSPKRHSSLANFADDQDLQIAGTLRVGSLSEGRRENLSLRVEAPMSPDRYYYGAFLPSIFMTGQIIKVNWMPVNSLIIGRVPKTE